MAFYTGPFSAPNIVLAPAVFPAADLVRSITSHTTGSWYFEMVVNVAANIAQVGVGIDNGAEDLMMVGGQAGGICWLGDGSINYNGVIGAYSGTSFSVGDVLGVNVILPGSIQFRVNGGSFSSFSISAITGGAMFALAQTTVLGDQITANFTGVSPSFSFTAPSTAWG